VALAEYPVPTGRLPTCARTVDSEPVVGEMWGQRELLPRLQVQHLIVFTQQYDEAQERAAAQDEHGQVLREHDQVLHLKPWELDTLPSIRVRRDDGHVDEMDGHVILGDSAEPQTGNGGPTSADYL
jgi:hypothetical protein